MIKNVLILCFLGIYGIGLSQPPAEYGTLVQEAEQFYHEKSFLESGKKYAAAFKTFGNKGYINDRYNAACSWALAGVPDSAFVNLLKISKGGYYTNLNHLTVDPDLKSLYGDPRWEEVVGYVKVAKEKAEANLDKPLVAKLDTIYREDQGLRMQIDSIMKAYGNGSPEMQAHWQKIIVADSINQIKVTEILDERGWLGADIIGGQGNLTLFLVIQHADLETQLKYLPMMREAVQKGAANAANLALLEDRTNLRQGKHQIYGSQISQFRDREGYYIMPLLDPDNVDQRRAAVGLPPLQNYVSGWGITWDVEAYKKQLPELEELEFKK